MDVISLIPRRNAAAISAAAVLAGILHAQMHRSGGKRPGQGEDIRVIAHKLPLRIRQRLLEGRPRLESHAPGNPRLPRTHDVDGAGVLLRQMAAAHAIEARNPQ